MGKLYTQLLADIPGLQLPIAQTDYAENIYWVYSLVLTDELPISVAAIVQRLAQQQIGTRPFFWCMHEQPVFQKMGLFAGAACPVAERIARRGFYIPSGLALTIEQIERVAQTLRDAIDAELEDRYSKQSRSWQLHQRPSRQPIAPTKLAS
jgi:perosamine synthetase